MSDRSEKSVIAQKLAGVLEHVRPVSGKYLVPSDLLQQAVDALTQKPPSEAEPVGQMTDKLLPCPWCRSQPDIQPWHGGGPEKHMVSCDEDECEAGPKVTGETRLEAIAAWNRRCPPPSAPAGVEGAPIRYFAYDSDCGDYSEFDTLPEAIADAQEALDYAGSDGWPPGGPSIYYGAVLGEAREVEGSRRPAGQDDHPNADFIVEYELAGSCALAQVEGGSA